MKKLFLIFLSALGLAFNLSGQSALEQADILYNQDSFEEANQAYLRSLNDNLQDTTRARVLNLVAEYYLNTSDFDSTDFYLDSTLDLAKKLNDRSLIAEVYLSRHYKHDFKGEFKQAHKNILIADSMYRELNDDKHHGQCLMRLGSAYQKMNQDSLALKYFMDAIDIHEKMGFDQGLARTYQALGHYYSVLLGESGEEEDYAKAKEYSSKAIEFFKKSNQLIPVANCLNTLASLKSSVGDFEGALADYQESLSITKRENNEMGTTWNYSSLTYLYLDNGKFEEANIYADSAYNYAVEIGMKDAQSSALRMKSEILYTAGDYQEAFHKLYEYNDLNDTIYSNANYQQSAELQAKYDSVKKDLELAESEHQVQIEKNKRFWMWLVFAIIMILSLIIINRELKRKKKAEELSKAMEENLTQKLEYKNRELTSLALQIAQKNELINSLDQEINKINSEGENKAKLSSLKNKLKIESSTDKFWDQFTHQFNETHSNYFKSLTNAYPDLSKNDLRLSSLIRMNLSTKEMASILNVTDEGIKKARYRLRKKLMLASDVNIEQHLMQF